MATSEACARCGRAAPDADSSEYRTWEATDDGSGNVVLLCPDCLRQETLDEDAFAMADEVTLVVTDDEDTDADDT